MKALLIYPPTFNMIKTNLPTFVDTQTGIYPPLGLLYIAAYAQKNTNFEIELLDFNAQKFPYEEIEKRIAERQPDVVGIQAFTFSLIDAVKVADVVKKINPGTHVCMGGPHASIYPVETLNFHSVDSVVRDEGEYAFADILNNLERKNDLSCVKGILFKKNGKIIDTGSGPFLSDKELDALPHPARNLIPKEKYYSLLAETNPITTLITSRGCPFKCIFCDRPQMGKVFRSRNADNIIEELSISLESGIKEFFFYDDTFTVNKNRVLEFCDKLIAKGLNGKIIWDIRSRIDTVDEEMIKNLRRAGCKRIHYGVEAGTERILKMLRKGISLEGVRHIFKITAKSGIQTLAYFILGNPGETKHEIDETVSFAKKLNPDYVLFSLLTPFPGTELYKMALDKDIAKFDYWKRFAENPSVEFEPMFWEENFTKENLSKILIRAYKSFYLRPSYLLKQSLKLKSLSEFKRKLNAGVKLIK